MGTAAVVGGLATPTAQLALRQIGLASYAWRQAATLAGAIGVLTTVYLFDTHDWLTFNMVAYRAEPPKLGQYVQYWTRAALIRYTYFTHVGKAPGYMVTLEEVFQIQSISKYIDENGAIPFLPAT